MPSYTWSINDSSLSTIFCRLSGSFSLGSGSSSEWLTRLWTVVLEFLLLDMISRCQTERMRTFRVHRDLFAHIQLGLVLDNQATFVLRIFRCCPRAKPAKHAALGPQSSTYGFVCSERPNYSKNLFPHSYPRLLIMVATYTIFGRQVGSHIVSLKDLIHASPFSLILNRSIKQPMLIAVTACNSHPRHDWRRNSIRYEWGEEGEGARAANQC